MTMVNNWLMMMFVVHSYHTHVKFEFGFLMDLSQTLFFGENARIHDIGYVILHYIFTWRINQVS